MASPTEHIALVRTEPAEPLVTVEIETFAKSPPKIRVKISGNDPDETLETALSLYQEALRESAEIWAATNGKEDEEATDE